MRPNLLFVFSDQHRWCDMNHMGNKDLITPNFDKFSEEAVVLTHCLSNTPVCVPARGSLLTGLFPMKHRAVSNDLPIDTSVESIADVMNRKGYETGYIGKWHLAGVPRDQYVNEEDRLGFKGWKVANCTHSYMDSYYYDEQNEHHKYDIYEPIGQTDLALSYIKSKAQSDKGPWGLVLSWGPPHDPYQEVPERYKELYTDLEPSLRKNVQFPAVLRPDRLYSKEQIEDNLRGYYAHITALDEQFGRLIQCLEETGQLDNTIILYTSDHGDMIGSQGTTNKQWAYEESIRVPLMVYWKGHTKALWTDELIGLIDLPTSLLSMMDMSFTQQVDGSDLSHLFTEADAKGLDACYLADYIPCHQAYWRGSSEWRGLRTNRYTYVTSGRGKAEMLYDNKEDPFQLKNVVEQEAYGTIRQELDDKLSSLVEKYDGYYSSEGLIEAYGLKEEWNRSQAYFNLPLMD